MSEELRNAFDRWLAANNAADALAVFIEICGILASIVPGFICPFAESSDPTLGEQWVYVSLWQAKADAGVFEGTGD